MRGADELVRQEFKRRLNGHHIGFLAGIASVFAIILMLVGLPELGLSIYCIIGIGLSIAFKQTFRRVQNAMETTQN